jgi:hypothetical protein
MISIKCVNQFWDYTQMEHLMCQTILLLLYSFSLSLSLFLPIIPIYIFFSRYISFDKAVILLIRQLNLDVEVSAIFLNLTMFMLTSFYSHHFSVAVC